ncbi:hypothetical protein niasHS_007209 [Heterodera schachtii]|uniref:Uncharacterized protein n=1 Tax=Heterodera schachtii TaxID=97005 RepID=A0ABD2JK03_HETSC
MAGPDSRFILEFFNREAKEIGVTQELLNNSQQSDQLIQAYYFLCDLIFENVGTTKENECEVATDLTRARPKMIIRTQQHSNLVFNKLFDGSNEFLYSDLLQPDPRRTKMHIAQLIRLYTTKCDIAKELSAVDNHIDEQMKAHDFEKNCERSTHAQLKDREEALNRMETRNDEMGSKVRRFKDKLNDRQALAEDEKRNVERIDKILLGAQCENDECKELFAQEEENRKRLDNNIVNSPERIIEELSNMEAEVEDIRRKNDQAVQNDRKLEREYGEQRVTSQCVESLINGMQKLEMMQEQMVEMRAKEEERRKQMDDLEMTRKNLMAEIEVLERQSTTDLESLGGEVNHRAKSLAMHNQQKAQLESDEKELAKQLKKKKDDIRQHQQEIKRKDRSFIILTDTYDDSVAKLFKNLSLVEQKVQVSRSNLLNLFNENAIFGPFNQ